MLVSGVNLRYIAVVSLISFIFAVLYAYFYEFSWFRPFVHDHHRTQPRLPSQAMSKCNIFDGKWIPDGSYPLYDTQQCPFVDAHFDCLGNGKKDIRFLNWRWKPKDCDIPRFNVRKALEKLRGKRVVFVGDSLSRQQWESMICMLMTGVEDKKSVYEINGNNVSKIIRFLGIYFSSFNLRIDYYKSVFLVQSGIMPKHAPKRVKSAIRLDKLDDISNEWIDSDILLFNSAHWWTKTKLSDRGCYFEVGNSMKLGMPISTAFRKALSTWSSWVEASINPNRTRVFFRTFESTHWSGQHLDLCNVTHHPSSNTNGMDRNLFSDIIINTVKKMTIPVTVLHVTAMGAFRSDAHIGTWSEYPPDCTHWCLPGLPDMWNEILLSNLLIP